MPIEEVAPDGPLHAVPLNGRQVRNLLLMLATRQLVQAAFVGVALFTFFLILGLVVVTPETAEQWIGAEPVRSALLPGVPVALLCSATLLSGFGSMYFAVTSMSDADHRRQFFAPILDEVERMLAVRAVYLVVRTASRAKEGPSDRDGHLRRDDQLAAAFANTWTSPSVRNPPDWGVRTTQMPVVRTGVTGTSITGVPSVPTGTSALASTHTPAAFFTCTCKDFARPVPLAPSRWKCVTTRVTSRAFGRFTVIVSDGFCVPDFQFDQAFSAVTPSRSRAGE